jgi:hypothetical protein
MKLPERKLTSDTTEVDVQEFFNIIPNIASYLACCVSKDGKESEVGIQITAKCGTKRWGMDLTIPGWTLEGIEHIDGENIPRASTVLEASSPFIKVPDGVVIAKSSAEAEGGSAP